MQTHQPIQIAFSPNTHRPALSQSKPVGFSALGHQSAESRFDEVRFQSSTKSTRQFSKCSQSGYKKWLLGLMLLPGVAYSQSPQTSHNGRLSAHSPLLVEQARNSDVIPGVQSTVHQKMGWTGKGVRVHLIDQFFVQEKSNGLPGSDVMASNQITHGQDMATLIRSVAPDATLTASDMREFPRLDKSAFPDLYALKLKDDMTILDGYIVKQAASKLDMMSLEFEALAKLPDFKRPHIVNMSMGLTLKALMEHLHADLYQAVESRGAFVWPYPKYRQIVLGNDAENQNADVRKQRMGMYIEVLMIQDAKAKGPFSEALKRYELACKTLREKGTLIIVSVGNDGESYPNLMFTDMGPAKFRQNILSMNPYVLSVGSVDNNQTPDYPRDDKASAHNSPGPVGFLMSGTQVMIDRPSLGKDVLAGSSCSASLTSGMAALLVQKIQSERQPLSADTLQKAIVASGETISVSPSRLELAEVSSKNIPAYSPPRLVGQLK